MSPPAQDNRRDDGRRDDGRRDGNRRDEDGVRRFVERFALDLTASGVPRMPARVFAAILAAENGRSTAADLAEHLQVSPAAVSGAVRYLTQTAMVTREREPGARRDHYRVREDQWYQAIAQQDALMAQWAKTLNEGLTAVGTGSEARARLTEAHEFVEFVRQELPALLARWREHRS